jgi:hypothetical protein
MYLKQAARIRSKAKCAVLQIPHWTTRYRLLTCLKMANSEPGIYGRYARQQAKSTTRAFYWLDDEARRASGRLMDNNESDKTSMDGHV